MQACRPHPARVAATTLALLSACWAGSAAAVAPAVPPPADAAAPVRTAAAPWWAAFQDPLLDQLLAQAGGGSPAAQLALARSYIELRVAQARLLLAAQLQQGAVQQRAWLEQQQPETAEAVAERSRWLALLATRSDHWRAVQRYLGDEQDRCEAQLAALARQEAATLHARLQPGAGTVPRSSLQLPGQLVVSAGDDGGALLQALQVAAAQAARARALAQAGELDLQSSRLRQEAGMATPLDVLESWQQLVAGVDRLAALDGALALAWAHMLQRGGPLAQQAVAD